MNNKRFMHRFLTHVLTASVTVGAVFSPLTVLADSQDGWIRTYNDFLNPPVGQMHLQPDADFKWPTGGPASIELNTELLLYDNWTVPKNITVNQHAQSDTNGNDRWNGKLYNIDLWGTWNVSNVQINHNGGGTAGTISSMTAKEGSVLNIGMPNESSSASISERLKIEKGAALNLNGDLQFSNGSELVIDKGAVVNADAGDIFLSGGSIHGENTRFGSVRVSDGMEEMKSSITGAVTVDRLTLYSDLVIPSGTALTVDGTLYCRDGQGEPCTITVESGATLSLGDLFQYGKIIAKKGSTINMMGRWLRIGDSGANASLVLEDAIVNLPDTMAKLMIAEGSSVTGNGTLHFGSAYGAITGDGTVAKTVKIEHDGNCIYEASGKDAACILCGKKNGQSGSTSGGSSVTAKEPKKGETAKVGGVTYKVTKSGSGRTVTYYKAPKKSKVAVPSKVTYKGRSYSVTAVASKAFYKNTKVTSVTIPTSVKTIGAQAFYKCTNLKSVTIGKNVNSIGKQSFYGCKKLKTVTIKSTKLTAKKVGSKAFAGIYSKATVRVPKSKVKAYKKLLISKGLGKKAKVKK